MAKKSTKNQKTFVLDTNILVRDPDVLFNFEDNDIFIPGKVAEELELQKEGNSSKAQSIRELWRRIVEIETRMQPDGWSSIGAGLGRLCIELETPYDPHFAKDKEGNQRELEDRPDNRILQSAYRKAQELAKKGQTLSDQVILVTNDNQMRSKALRLGLKAERYFHEEIKEIDILEKPIKNITVQEEEALTKFKENDLIVSVDDPDRRFRYNKGKLHEVIKRSCLGFYPKNPEQIFALDALLDPSIKIIALTGHAGTGKTFLPMIAALAQQGNVIGELESEDGLSKAKKKHLKKAKHKKENYQKQGSPWDPELQGRYERIYFMRPPIVVTGKDRGALPGNESRKNHPYVEPMYLQLDWTITEIKKRFVLKEDTREKMRDAKKIDDLNIDYIAGITLYNSFVIIDEAQDLSTFEIKQIVERGGDTTKLVFTGDLSQIHELSLNERSSGLTHLIASLEGCPQFCHIHLVTNQRGDVSDMGKRIK